MSSWGLIGLGEVIAFFVFRVFENFLDLLRTFGIFPNFVAKADLTAGLLRWIVNFKNRVNQPVAEPYPGPSSLGIPSRDDILCRPELQSDRLEDNWGCARRPPDTE